MSVGRQPRAARRKQHARQQTLDVREQYVAETGNVERPAEVVCRTRGKKPEGYKLRPTKHGDER